MKTPEVLLAWEETVAVLMDYTMKFPKSTRFTFAQRMEHLALDVLEALTSARFTSRGHTHAALRVANDSLVRLRALIRLGHQRRLLSNQAYEQLSRRLEATGRSVGGWTRALQGSKP